LVNEKYCIAVPSLAIRIKAIEIVRTGNSKSGYPELSDSLYHALAIVNDAIFVTNDSKHVAKLIDLVMWKNWLTVQKFLNELHETWQLGQNCTNAAVISCEPYAAIHASPLYTKLYKRQHGLQAL
jgi:hypothetical protein